MEIERRIEAVKLAEKIASVAWGNLPHAVSYVAEVQRLAAHIDRYFKTGTWENKDG